MQVDRQSHGVHFRTCAIFSWWICHVYAKNLFLGNFFSGRSLAGHCWKHCHTLDLCCLNSVHRMFDHRLIVFKVYFSHRHFHICFKWLFYNYLWLSVKFLLDLLWIFNLQNCYSNPHCSHKLDSSVSQASFLKQKRWLALATSFPTQSGNSSGHGFFSSDSSSPITSAYSVDKCVNFEKGV